MRPLWPSFALLALTFLLVQGSKAETAKRGQKITLKHGGNDIAKKVQWN